MEANNICDLNHLESDVILPPRKRLLAGLKKQVSDVGENSLQISLSSSSSPASASSSSSSPSSDELNARLSNFLSSSHHAGLSPEEIVAASKSAAVAALRAAGAARAAAENKAAEAAKAVAAAKSALDLVACFSEETICKERNPRKNKLKKHVPVQLLYTKYRPIENCKKDEELARKLHRAINSSPRIVTKNSPGSEKNSKHKKPKISTGSEKSRESNGDIELAPNQNHMASSNGHVPAVEVDV